MWVVGVAARRGGGGSGADLIGFEEVLVEPETDVVVRKRLLRLLVRGLKRVEKGVQDGAAGGRRGVAIPVLLRRRIRVERWQVTLTTTRPRGRRLVAIRPPARQFSLIGYGVCD